MIGELINGTKFMKKLFLLTVFVFITISCDVPQRAESITEFSTPISTGTSGNGTNPILPGGGGGFTQNLAPGYEYCTNTTPYNGQTLGMFGLCRHSSDERKFRVKFVNASTSGTCFVPTHRLSNGTSFKLGIAECVHNQAGSSYYMTLNKETVPPNYTNPRSEAINSVMVLSAENNGAAVNAYMACMNAKESYFLSARQVLGNYQSPPCCLQGQNSPNGMRCLQPNPSCDQAANAHASGVCNSFVQNFSTKYKQVIF